MNRRWNTSWMFACHTAIFLGCVISPTLAQTPPDEWQFRA